MVSVGDLSPVFYTVVCCTVVLQIPEYFSWSMMVRNQLAPELPPGTRLFYPDNEGESIPISDDEVGTVSRTDTTLRYDVFIPAGFCLCTINTAQGDSE